jgi:hypothetical protein
VGWPIRIAAKRGAGVHVVVGEHPDGFHLVVVQKVCFLDDDDGCASAFGVFGGQGVGGLRRQGGGIEAGDLPERGDDVVQHAADPDGRVGQIDDHVPGAVQGGGGGADGDGLAGADLAGDHSEGVLVDAPADAGDGFGVSGVAVQHAGGQVPPEGHAGEAVVVLQPLDTHAPASSSLSVSLSVSMSSMDSWPGSWPSLAP